MIQVHTQYSLNKDHQLHKWRQQKQWTLHQGYQVVQDKQLTRSIRFFRRSKMEDVPKVLKIPKSECPDTFVYHDTNGPNHGPVWKTRSFLSKGICTVILWQDFHEKGNSRKFYFNAVGKKFQIVNAYSLTEKEDYSCLCTWTTSTWQERNKIWIQCGKYSWKKLIWESRHHFLTMFIWVALKENAKQAKTL